MLCNCIKKLIALFFITLIKNNGNQTTEKEN